MLYADLSATSELAAILATIFSAFTAIMTTLIGVLTFLLRNQQTNNAIRAQEAIETANKRAKINSGKIDEVHTIVNDRQSQMIAEIMELRKQVDVHQAILPKNYEELMEQVAELRKKIDQKFAKAIEAAKQPTPEQPS